MVVLSAHVCQSNAYPLHPHRVTWIQTKKGGGVKSGCSDALKQGKLGLICKPNKCSDAGAGDLSVLTTTKHRSVFPLVIAAQPPSGE